MAGVNTAVVGLLLAAPYAPVWTSALHSAMDAAIGLGAFMLLAVWRWPPWFVVVLGAATAAALGAWRTRAGRLERSFDVSPSSSADSFASRPNDG